MPRFFEEGDAPRTIFGVVASEIIRLEEKEHTASALFADSRALSIGVRSCEEKRAAAATWRNDDPTLPGGELCVLDHLETEVPSVERDRFVIVPDEQCGE
jgi:hypothetical protein